MASLGPEEGYSVVAESLQDSDAPAEEKPWSRRARVGVAVGIISSGALMFVVLVSLFGRAPWYPSGGDAPGSLEVDAAPIEAAYEAAGAACAATEQGITFKGGFTFSATGVLSLQECCARCHGTPPCRAWVWRSAVSQCWLKAGRFIGKLPLAGAVAGLLPERQPVLGLTQFRFNFQAVHHDPKAKPLAFGCKAQQLPQLWSPRKVGSPVQLKVMTYNLEWWNLFDKAHAPDLSFYRTTAGNGGTQLVTRAAAQGAYDILAFQECADGGWLAAHANLGAFTVLAGEDGRCMAFRKEAWTLIAAGGGNVAEDTLGMYYGKRGAGWVRLRNVRTGATVFFMNHHGPLPQNSGGACGPAATAYNLLQMIAVNGRSGDAIILAGDFNANAAGMTIKMLDTKLTRAMAGTADGGIDFVFSNNVPVIGRANLGSGGSDHQALGVTFQVGA